MIITAGEVRYEVRFYHDGPVDPGLERLEIGRETTCEIFDASDYEMNEDSVPLAEGVACCMYLDNFSRAKGCKLSFSRAIVNFPHHVRKEFWDQYFKVHTNGKRKAGQ